MATEDLTYRVTFDTSEVAQKLAEVKNSMDIAFGAQAFNMAGADTYPFQGSAQQGVQMAQGTFADIQNVFNTVAETSRLGYSKFTRDLEMTGLMAGSMRGAPQALTYGQHMQQIQQGGLWDDITGGMGFGYSPTMPMSAREYKRAHRQEAVDDFMTPSWGEAIGVGVGAAFAGGPVGWGMVGLGAAALGTKAALYPFTSELRHQRALESYVGGTSWRFLSGQFGREDREDLGQYLRELPDQPSIAARGYGRGEVDEMLSTFTEAGGFDYVRNAREYRDKTKQLFEGHRELMHTLHVTSKEATALMGQLSKELGVDSFTGFSAQVGVLADRAGLTRTEAASFMMQSAEMVRGTGYEMKGFALGAGRLLEDVRDMSRTGIISQEDLRQFGGEQGIAQGMARSAMNFAGSPMGFVTQAALMSAQLGGGAGGAATALGQMASMGVQGQLGATAGLLTSPMAFARLFGAQQRLADEIGPELAMQQKTMSAVQQAQMVFGRRTFESQDLYGAFRAMGYDHREAREMVMTRDAAGREDIPTMRQDYYNRGIEAYRQMEEEGISPFDRYMQETGAAIEGAVWKPITGAAETAHIGIERGVRMAGRRLGRFMSDITGGIFDVESVKPGGLASRWRIGGGYAARHRAAMSVNAKDAKLLDKELLGHLDDGSAIKIGKSKRIALTAEEIRQRGGGGGYAGAYTSGTKLIEEEFTLDELEAAESQKELGRYLEDYGREGAMFAVGTTGNTVIDLATKLLTGAAYQSDISEIIEQTGKDVGFEEGELQADLARSFATSATEYFRKRKAGELGGQETLGEYQLRTAREDFRGLKLGPKQRKAFFGMIGGMGEGTRIALTRTGLSQLRKDLETEETAITELATSRLAAKGIDAPTKEQIQAERRSIGEDELLGSLIGATGEEVAGRSEAGGIFRERLAKTIAGGADLFGKMEGNNLVFDETSSKIAMAMNSQIQSDALVKMTSGGMADEDAIPVKTVN
jgi:hypothetical protein